MVCERSFVRGIQAREEGIFILRHNEFWRVVVGVAGRIESVLLALLFLTIIPVLFDI